MASSHPFRYNMQLEDIVFELAVDKESKSERFRNIHNWVAENISYDDELAERIISLERAGLAEKDGTYTLRDSLEVFQQGEGICSEQSLLVITMARLAQIKTVYVYVTVDAFGNDTNHACAGAYLEEGFVLSDPVYGIFNALHERYRVFSGREAVRSFMKTNMKLNSLFDFFFNEGYAPKIDEPGKTLKEIASYRKQRYQNYLNSCLLYS